MACFEVAVTRRTESGAGFPIARRHVLGRFGAVLASIAAAPVAVVVVTALVLGYFNRWACDRGYSGGHPRRPAPQRLPGAPWLT
jgi:hypothetical protein